MYVVCLRLRRGAPLPWSVTRTPDRDGAVDAFADFVNCAALDRMDFEVEFICVGKVVAVHRFMAPAGSGHDWRGRIAELWASLLE